MGSSIGRIIVKNVGLNEYSHDQRGVKTINIFANGARPKTNQLQRKTFGKPTGSFDNTASSEGVTSKYPNSGDHNYNGNHMASNSFL